MSKIYETITPEPKPYTMVKTRKCDLCGAEAKGEEWEARGIYNVEETEIEVVVRQKTGNHWGDSGNGTKHEIDLCPKCFKEKLIPWLVSQGADIKTEEWDF